MSTEKTKEQLANHAIALSNVINDAIAMECIAHGYSDVEVYIAIRYYLARLQAVLGKDRVKKLESSFTIANLGQTNIC